MRVPTPNQPRIARLSKSMIAAALLCAAGTAAAQSVYQHVDSAGHKTFSDRREAPVVRRELAPLAGQTGPDSEIRGRGPNSSAARSRSIDQDEANRRLNQAIRERARGPDMQQGIPPIAERLPGERRRGREEALQHDVETAQARVRELEAQVSLAAETSRVGAKMIAVSALR